MTTTHASAKIHGFDKAKEGLKRTGEGLLEGMYEGREKISEKAYEAKDKVKEQLDVYSNQLIDYVKESPLKAVGIAALAGFLICAILKK